MVRLLRQLGYTCICINLFVRKEVYILGYYKLMALTRCCILMSAAKSAIFRVSKRMYVVVHDVPPLS